MAGRRSIRMSPGCSRTRTAILEALRTGYGVGAARFDELIEEKQAEAEPDALRQEVTVLEDNEEATIMSFVNQIFSEAIRERATDIHVEPLENDLRIRYRVDGALNEVAVPPNVRLLQNSLVSRLKIMAHLDIAERRLPQDGRINLELGGQRYDVRVATIPSVNGESVSLRLLGRERLELATLGMDAALEARIRSLLALPNGIILVTGPTGCGKSSTLYTFLRELNTKERRIVTIEDPVENKLDGVVQIAVKPEINLTFAAGLRSILRGDPNVIMVGEMRDLETTEIAIRGALTGHLVFSTLHTNDAVGGISRLLDMGIEPFLIASSVRAFLAQRLVRRLCPHCCQPAAQHQHQPITISNRSDSRSRRRIASSVAGGCRECRGTGYRGRMAIIEICADHQRNAGTHHRSRAGIGPSREGRRARNGSDARIRLAESHRGRNDHRRSDRRHRRRPRASDSRRPFPPCRNYSFQAWRPAASKIAGALDAPSRGEAYRQIEARQPLADSKSSRRCRLPPRPASPAADGPASRASSARGSFSSPGTRRPARSRAAGPAGAQRDGGEAAGSGHSPRRRAACAIHLRDGQTLVGVISPDVAELRRSLHLSGRRRRSLRHARRACCSAWRRA